MEDQNNIDKYVVKILRHLQRPKPPDEFTEKIMNKIFSLQFKEVKTEPYAFKKFFLIFLIVFISMLILSFYLPEGDHSVLEKLAGPGSLIKEITSRLHFISNPIFSKFQENTLLKVIPFAIIILILFERILLKFSDRWKE